MTSWREREIRKFSGSRRVLQRIPSSVPVQGDGKASWSTQGQKASARSKKKIDQKGADGSRVLYYKLPRPPWVENTTVLGNPPKIFPNSTEKICWVNHKGYPTWSRSAKYWQNRGRVHVTSVIYCIFTVLQSDIFLTPMFIYLILLPSQKKKMVAIIIISIGSWGNLIRKGLQLV